MAANPELGRQLTAAELVSKTVVVLGRVDRATMVTCWVAVVGADYVAFEMGEVRTVLIAYLREDGKLTDDTGKELLVFEYLGII